MLAEGSACSRPPDTPLDAHPGTQPDVDQVCEVIDRLELHRRCIEEALADAYWELMAMLRCGQEGAGQEGAPGEGAGREAARPF